MIYLFRDIDTSKKTKWGREVKIKTVRLQCEIMGSYGKDEVFIKLYKNKYFPMKGRSTIRVLRSAVIEG
jgi:hypothetical protein